MHPILSALRAILLLGALPLLVLRCGVGDGGDRFPAAEQAAAVGHGAPANVGCKDGAVAPCVEIYGQHAGIVNCFEGEKTCVDGAWSDCVPVPEEGDEPASVD
jgi:hypothetical protein